MAHQFWWKGGVNKPDDYASYKFFMFALLEDEEVIHYEAVKRGIFVTSAFNSDAEDALVRNLTEYTSIVRDVKIFMSRSGFGVHKSYYSFFFRFDRKSTKTITIRPFGTSQYPNTNFAFKARGRFLSSDEIRALLGEDSKTYGFYKKQTYLSKADLRRYVRVTTSGACSSGVRFLRV